MKKLLLFCIFGLAACKNPMATNENLESGVTSAENGSVSPARAAMETYIKTDEHRCGSVGGNDLWCYRTFNNLYEDVWLMWLDKNSIRKLSQKDSPWEGDVNVYIRHTSGSLVDHGCRRNRDAKTKQNEVIVKTTTNVLSTSGLMVRSDSCGSRENCFSLPELYPTLTRDGVETGWSFYSIFDIGITTATPEGSEQVLSFGYSEQNKTKGTEIKGQKFPPRAWISKALGFTAQRCANSSTLGNIN